VPFLLRFRPVRASSTDATSMNLGLFASSGTRPTHRSQGGQFALPPIPARAGQGRAFARPQYPKYPPGARPCRVTSAWQTQSAVKAQGL
jgi:hypothetical protein